MGHWSLIWFQKFLAQEIKWREVTEALGMGGRPGQTPGRKGNRGSGGAERKEPGVGGTEQNIGAGEEGS